MRQMPPDDPLSRTLDKIVKQAFRASEIVNHLLKFSRVSGSEYSELDLNKLVRETLSLVEPMLRASKISVNAQLCPVVAPGLRQPRKTPAGLHESHYECARRHAARRRTDHRHRLRRLLRARGGFG